MSSIEDRLRSSLDRRADQVQIADDAWAKIQARIRKPDRTARWRGPALIAASVVVVAGAAAIAVQAGVSQSSPAVPLAPVIATVPSGQSSVPLLTSAVSSTPPTPPPGPLASTKCNASTAIEATEVDISTDSETDLKALMSTDTTTPGSPLLCIRITGADVNVEDGVRSGTPTGVLQYAHVTAVPGGSIVWGGATVIAVAITLTDANGASTAIEADRLTTTSTGWVYFAVFEPDGQSPMVQATALDSAGRPVGESISLR